MSLLTRPAPAAEHADADHLCYPDFTRISQLIGDETGIRLPPAKRLMIEGRLLKRVRALGLRGLDDYSQFLFQRGVSATERVHLIDAGTTNKTDFFPGPEHFK